MSKPEREKQKEQWIDRYVKSNPGVAREQVRKYCDDLDAYIQSAGDVLLKGATGD